MNEQILNNINDIFSKKRNIVLIPHSSPDADALGSCLALYHFFIDNNNVNIISPNEYTDILNFLPGSEDVIVYENDKEISEKTSYFGTKNGIKDLFINDLEIDKNGTIWYATKNGNIGSIFNNQVRDFYQILGKNIPITTLLIKDKNIS